MASAPHDHGATRTTAHFEASRQAVLRAAIPVTKDDPPNIHLVERYHSVTGLLSRSTACLQKGAYENSSNATTSTKANGSPRSSASTIGINHRHQPSE
jgi:hypothetical protein